MSNTACDTGTGVASCIDGVCADNGCVGGLSHSDNTSTTVACDAGGESAELFINNVANKEAKVVEEAKEERNAPNTVEPVRRSEVAPTVSACLMVRNEEDNIEMCLDSFIDLVDEVIIVDTGSTDHTIDKAEAFSDKVKVYHHPWEDNFSLHRNQAAGYATSEWIFIIDADECLTEESGNLFKDVLLQAVDSDVVDFRIQNTVPRSRERVGPNEHTSYRLYRRDTDICYDGIVHNRLINLKDKRMFASPLAITHYGYAVSPEKKERKMLRTVGLLIKLLKEEETNVVAHSDMAKSMAWNQQWGECLFHAQRAIDLLGDRNLHDTMFIQNYHLMFLAYMNKNLLDEALMCITDGIAHNPDYVDLWHDMCIWAMAQKNRSLARYAAQKFMKASKNYQDGKTTFACITLTLYNTQPILDALTDGTPGAADYSKYLSRDDSEHAKQEVDGTVYEKETDDGNDPE